jgi:hypothetical protein
VVAHTYNPSYPGWRQEDCELEASLGKVSKTLSQKQNINKRVEGMVQVVEH